MKKIILLTILLLFIMQNGISQQEPRIKEYIKSYKPATDTAYSIKTESFYNYNLLGKITSLTTKEYDYFDNSLKSWKGIFYEYDNNQLLKTRRLRRYNSDVDLWITLSWIEYQYNANGCLIEETFIENLNGFYSDKKYYERNDFCQIISITDERIIASTIDTLVFTNFRLREYYSDGISYEERFFQNASAPQTASLEEKKIYIFNQDGNVVEEQRIFYNSFPLTVQTSAIKYLTEYDEHNNIKKITQFHQEDESTLWKLYDKKDFYHEYDNNGFLIKTREEIYEYSFPQGIDDFFTKVYDFKNSCKGIQEEKNLLHEGADQSRIKEEFFYEGKNECVDLEKLELNIIVYPNPSSGYFEISSSIFQTGNTEILVYSVDGKVLLQKTEINRNTNFAIDLSLLNNGFYILQLRNGDHFVKEKIVIAK